MTDDPKVGELTYEQAREGLTEVVHRLEAGGLALEESLALWERGEQLAIREFLRMHRDVRLVDYLNFGWHGKSFIVHLTGSDVAGGT